MGGEGPGHGEEGPGSAPGQEREDAVRGEQGRDREEQGSGEQGSDDRASMDDGSMGSAMDDKKDDMKDDMKHGSDAMGSADDMKDKDDKKDEMEMKECDGSEDICLKYVEHRDARCKMPMMDGMMLVPVTLQKCEDMEHEMGMVTSMLFNCYMHGVIEKVIFSKPGCKGASESTNIAHNECGGDSAGFHTLSWTGACLERGDEEEEDKKRGDEEEDKKRGDEEEEDEEERKRREQEEEEERKRREQEEEQERKRRREQEEEEEE